MSQPRQQEAYVQVQATEAQQPAQQQPPKAQIDVDEARFPCCIVWTPLPLITWFLPFIGHTGIGMSDGILHDFAGPYTIGIDDLAFGETHKYVQLDIRDSVRYDRSLAKAD